MTAHEEQNKRVIPIDGKVCVRRRHECPVCDDFARDRFLAMTSRNFTAQLIGHPPHCNVIEPSFRIVRNSFDWPLGRSRDERFLHSVFCGCEITMTSCDGAEHLRSEIAKQVLDTGVGH